MARHRRSLLSRIFAPIIKLRAFQAELDRLVREFLDSTYMAPGSISLNTVVQYSDKLLPPFALEVRGGSAELQRFLAGRHDALRQIEKSIMRVHRLALSRGYDLVPA